MHVADVALHVGVDDARADRQRGYERLLDGERRRDVVEHRFAGAVGCPALVGGYGCARGDEDDAPAGAAEGGDGGADLRVGVSFLGLFLCLVVAGSSVFWFFWRARELGLGCVD